MPESSFANTYADMYTISNNPDLVTLADNFLGSSVSLVRELTIIDNDALE